MPGYVNHRFSIACLLVFALGSAMQGADAQLRQDRGFHGMVASASSIASQVGADTLKLGGNAIDAACAVGFALAVVYPAAGNIGGGGFMLIRLADGRTTAIDYRETAPAAAQHNMYLDSKGAVIPSLSLVGYRAAGVPGTVYGLGLAQRKYGKLKWEQVVEPARKLAAEGFPVSEALAESLRSSKNLARFPESRRIFQNGGKFYKPGEIFKQPELAVTLARIQAKGPSEFYTGETASKLADAMKQNGGLITIEDLKAYKAVERDPLHGSYKGCDVYTMPPPSSGGAALLEMLNTLSRHDLAASGYASSRTDHLIIETMRRAFADRAEFMGDPDFVRVPTKGIVSTSYAAEIDRSIDLEHATPSSAIGHGKPQPYESQETTHFSVVDAEGNAASNTYTLNMGFGSCATVTGAGFLLNDEMDDFTSKPGVPNGFGLIQGEANSIAPRKRPLSSMTPTILTKNGKLYLVIGSPGGPTIINTVLQVIVNVVDHHMDLPRAIAAPRLHHQWLPDLAEFEPYAISEDVRTKLESMGHKLTPPRSTNRWGDAEGILIDPTSGERIGASDPRSADAAAIGY